MMDDLGPGELIMITLSRRKVQMQKLASTIGVSNSYLSNIIHQRKPLNVNIAAKISEELDLDLYDLMGRKARWEVDKKLKESPRKIA